MPLINYISTYANVFCLDMPGFGESEEFKNPWSLDEYVDFIINFINDLKIKELTVIGHSNGGRVAIKLANRKNLEFKINKIILMGSAGVIHKKSLIKKVKIYFCKFCKKILEISLIDKIFPNLLLNLKKAFGSEDYRNASPVLRESLVKLVNEDLTPFLPYINISTLLIWGENDKATPLIDGKIMEKYIPNSGLVSIRNGSHYIFLDNPCYVNNIIYSFLYGGE